MPILLAVLAALEFVAGLGVLIGSASAVHEILAAVLIGFSILTFGVSSVLAEIINFGKQYDPDRPVKVATDHRKRQGDPVARGVYRGWHYEEWPDGRLTVAGSGGEERYLDKTHLQNMLDRRPEGPG